MSILDRNLEELLRRANEPPQMDGEARDRIRGAVIAAAAARGASSGALRAGGTGAARPRSDRSRWRWRSVPVAASAAAALSLVVLIAVWGWMLGDDSRFTNDGPAPRAIELADGSAVLLDAGAELEVLGPRRVELVRGGAIFDVVPGKGRFVVRSEHGEIAVLGTRFFVSALADETRTAVIRGKVEIDNGAGSARLGAGELGVMRDGERPTRRPAPRLSHLTGWARQAPGFGTDAVAPVRRGNLIARFAEWPERDFPLAMRALEVDVHVDNQIARVAIDQTFFNHRVETLEGVYSFPLPPDAAISRLAMYVGGKRMEAGIVERQRGREIYEQIVHQRRDPALLEWMGGNVFQVRIFPLEGRTEKRILLSYTQALSRLYGDYSIRVPIPEIDGPVGRVSFRVRIVDCGDCEVSSTSHRIQLDADGDDRIVTYSATDHAIGDDLLLTVRDHRSAPRVAVDGDALIARVRPTLPDGGKADAARRPRRWVILHDTSGSRSQRDLAAQVHIIQRLVHELDETDQISVVAFDATRRVWRDRFVDVAEIPEAALAAWVRDESRDGVGETDLAAALELARDQLASSRADGYEPHVLLLSDGIVTGGEREAAVLSEHMRGQATVVAIAVGELEDASVLGALATATGGITASIDPGDDVDWRIYDLIAALNTPRVVGLEVALEDAGGRPVAATSIYPSSRQLADGEELTLIAGFAGPALEAAPSHVRLTGTVDGEAWSQRIALPAVDPGERAGYLARLAAQRRIEALLAEPGDAHQDAIVALAMKHWLMTPYTSLIVLENEEMYRQFKVARSSERGWAPYRAPATIPVVYEPPARPTAGADVPIGDVVVREPPVLFHQMPGAGGQVVIGDGLGVVSLRSAGTGAGGGGFASGFEFSSGFDDTSAWFVDGRRDANGLRILGLVDPSAAEPWHADAAGADSSLLPREDWVVEAYKRPAGLNEQQVARRPASSRGGGGKYSEAWHRGQRGWHQIGGLLVPAGLHYAGDPRFADVSSFVPALMTTDFDRARQALLDVAAQGSFAHGSVDDAAVRLIAAARRAVAMRRYVDRDGRVVRVDGRGGIAIDSVQLGRLREQLIYDGQRLIHSYPELGLAVTRDVGDAEPGLLAALAPFLFARADALARWYRVTASGRTITLRSVADDRTVLQLSVDERDRPIEIRRISGRSSWVEVAFVWSGDSVQIVRGTERSVLSFERDFSIALADLGDQVVVELPLRSSAPRQTPAGAAGSPAWLDAAHQLLAVYAATGDTTSATVVADQLARWRGRLSDGELVLASAAVVRSGDPEAVRRALGDSDSAIAGYVRASIAADRGETGALDRVGAGNDGLVATLAAYRALLVRIVGVPTGAAAGARRIAEFSRRGEPALTYIAAHQLSASWSWRQPEIVVRAWDAVGGEPWRLYAAYQAARALASAGRHDQAANRFERAIEEAFDAGVLLPIDWTVQQSFVTSGRGDAGWRLFWTGLRGRALDLGTPELLLELAISGQMFGLPADVDRLVARLADARIEDRALALAVVDGLIAIDRAAEASAVLGPIADDSPPELLERAAAIAERQGRLPDAARLLARVFEHRAGDGVALGQLRAERTRLIDLWSRVARTSGGQPRAEAMRAALTAAAEWRAIDPDNPAIDRLAAQLLFALDRDSDARRYLSTAIERHPGDGAAYEVVATALEQEGLTRYAEPLWARAVDVEPTNPTWLLRRSQALRALGRSAEARAMLDRITAGTWHERFAGLVIQAEQLRQAPPAR